eukprot:scaffold3044_cov123-Skeletonema_marinoi.AAC.3
MEAPPVPRTPLRCIFPGPRGPIRLDIQLVAMVAFMRQMSGSRSRIAKDRSVLQRHSTHCLRHVSLTQKGSLHGQGTRTPFPNLVYFPPDKFAGGRSEVDEYHAAVKL